MAAPKEAPIPIPAFAPAERPWDCVGEVAEFVLVDCGDAKELVDV